MPSVTKLKSSRLKMPTFAKAIPWLITVTGVLGLVFAAILMFETIQLNNNKNYIPNCNLNPILNCGSVIKAETSFLHGYLNPLIGLMTFPVLITTGVILLSGVKLKRWYWLGLQGGSVAGIGFIAWLFYSSLYKIHALCPYCMAIWVVTITFAWYVTLYNIEIGYIKLRGRLKTTADFVARHHIDFLLLIFLIIAAVILNHFWYYYGHYI